MAVTSNTKNVPKKPQATTSSSPTLKVVLASPFTVEWPNIPQDFLGSVRDELVTSTSGMKLAEIKANWSELSKFKKDERVEKRRQLIEKQLEEMSIEDREKFDLNESEKKSKWNHIIHGYNNVMRHLQKNKLVGIFVKKNVTPDILGLGFVPVCYTKNVPLIAIDDLDMLKNENLLGVKHSITVLGLKKSVVNDADCIFKDLHAKMLRAWNSKIFGDTDALFTEITDEITNESIQSKQTPLNSDKNMLNHQKKHKKSPPKVDVTKYHLKRMNATQRVFMSEEEVKTTGEFISLNKVSKYYNKIASKEDKLSDVDVKVDPETCSTNIDFDMNSDFFSFDTGDGNTNQLINKKRNKKSKGLKRKLSSNYIPATVAKMKANINKKKKVTNKK